MRVIVKNVKLVTGEPVELAVRDGRFVETDAGEVLDGHGLFVKPGLCDPHVHLRDPGQTHKEDVATGKMCIRDSLRSTDMFSGGCSPLRAALERLLKCRTCGVRSAFPRPMFTGLICQEIILRFNTALKRQSCAGGVSRRPRGAAQPLSLIHI